MEYFGIFEDTSLSQYFPPSHFPQQVAFNTQLFKTHSPPFFEHVKNISNIEKSKYLEYQKWVYIPHAYFTQQEVAFNTKLVWGKCFTLPSIP